MRVATFTKKMQGKIFSVEFIKKDGTKRKITARLDALNVNPVFVGKKGKVWVRCVTMPQLEVKTFALDRVLKVNALRKRTSMQKTISKLF